MPSEFERDLREAIQNLRGQRERLLASLRTLGDTDLTRGRRGGWVIKEVIEHVVDSEWHYAALIHRLREADGTTSTAGQAACESVEAALGSLAKAREALLAAVDGVTEEDFYRLGRGGGQAYSVLSVLQNVTQHDLEHGVQIDELRTSAPRDQRPRS